MRADKFSDGGEVVLDGMVETDVCLGVSVFLEEVWDVLSVLGKVPPDGVV